jgi:hypothetical protein
MAKKSSPGSQQNTVSVGNISDVKGNINIAGGDINTHQTTGLSAAEIKQLFDQPYTAIQRRENTPPPVKEILTTEVREIQSAVTQAAEKNQKVNEDSLTQHFRILAVMAPDILQVVVATLMNPALGIGVLVKKISEKAKEGTGNA